MKSSGDKTQAAEIAAKMMRSSYAVFYHEHVLDKEPGTGKHIPCIYTCFMEIVAYFNSCINST